MGVISAGLAWLTGQRAVHLSRSVVYSRGSDSVIVSATVGKSIFEETDSYGVVHRAEYRDYIIPVDGFTLGADRAVPRAGDRVTETYGGRTTVYVVAAPTGEQCYRELADRTAVRVHTVAAGDE